MSNTLRPLQPIQPRALLERALGPEGASDRTDEQRRLALLRRIAASGSEIAPVRDPAGTHGHRYAEGGVEIEADLKFLAERDYLDERFFDRVSLCNSCGSHHLNIREVCPGCGSADLSSEPMLHHFRCGFIGPITDFQSGPEKRLCPKCNGSLRNLGTDYERIGNVFACGSCGASCQDPPVAATCLSCGTTTPGDEMASTVVPAYRLTSLGAAALRRNGLYEDDGEFLHIEGVPIYRPSVFAELIEQEARRLKRMKSVFSLVALHVKTNGYDGDNSPKGMLTRIHDSLREIDVIGQLADEIFVALLPDTDGQGAAIVCKRLERLAKSDPNLTVVGSVQVKQPADAAAFLHEASGTWRR